MASFEDNQHIETVWPPPPTGGGVVERRYGGVVAIISSDSVVIVPEAYRKLYLMFLHGLLVVCLIYPFLEWLAMDILCRIHGMAYPFSIHGVMYNYGLVSIGVAYPYLDAWHHYRTSYYTFDLKHRLLRAGCGAPVPFADVSKLDCSPSNESRGSFQVRLAWKKTNFNFFDPSVMTLSFRDPAAADAVARIIADAIGREPVDVRKRGRS